MHRQLRAIVAQGHLRHVNTRFVHIARYDLVPNRCLSLSYHRDEDKQEGYDGLLIHNTSKCQITMRLQ